MQYINKSIITNRYKFYFFENIVDNILIINYSFNKRLFT